MAKLDKEQIEGIEKWFGSDESRLRLAEVDLDSIGALLRTIEAQNAEIEALQSTTLHPNDCEFCSSRKRWVEPQR